MLPVFDLRIPIGRFRVSDAVLAWGTAAAAFAIYLRTLLPGLGGFEDTPKFQYLGAVLGVAHQPGYPLYMLLGYMVSQLPVGTVAYRINLLSAVSAAVAVMYAVLLARAVGCSRPASIFGALILAFGAAFWTYAVVAEVYALAAALLLGVIYGLVRWEQTGRARHLFGACVCYALALGNHLAIAAAAPAIGVFLLIARARRTLRLRTVIAAGLVAASGFLFYGYIWIRTLQDAPHSETFIRTVGDFVKVFSARNYEHVLFYSREEIVTEQLPRMGHLVMHELGVLGIAATVIGLVALSVRHWRASLFCGATIACTLTLLLNLFGDLRGFLVIPYAVASVFVAAGGDAIHRAVARLPGRAWAATASALLVAAPLVPLTSNFAANDWSRRTQDRDFFRALWETLPDTFALVFEGYVSGHMAMYMHAVEDHSRRRFVRPLPDRDEVVALFQSGVPVLALERGRAALAPFGLAFEPVTLRGATLAEELGTLADGHLVAIAAAESDVPPDVVRALRLAEPPRPRSRPRPYQAWIAWIGGDHQIDAADAQAAVRWEVPKFRGRPGETQTLETSAGPDGAFVSIGERTLALAPRGLAVLVLDHLGSQIASYTATEPEYRVVLPPVSHQAFQLKRLAPQAHIGDGEWHDVTRFSAAGSLSLVVDNYRPFDANVVLYVAGDHPMPPFLWEGQVSGPAPPTIDVTAFDRARSTGQAALAAALREDDLDPAKLSEARHVFRVAHVVNDEGQQAGWAVAFSQLPRRVLAKARVDLPNPRRAAVFEVPSIRLLEHTSLQEVGVGGYQEWLFGEGWHRAHRDQDGSVRLTAASRAHLVLPFAEARPVKLGLRVMAPDAGEAVRSVGLEVNGKALSDCAVGAGWQWCEWTLDAAHMRAGGNDLVVRSEMRVAAEPADAPIMSRTRGVALRLIRVRAR